jgi:hypothetical protein
MSSEHKSTSIDSDLEPDFIGDLSFQSDKVDRGIVATGNQYAVVDSATGGFKEWVGTDNITVKTPIYNGRLKPNLTLDTAGFELAKQTLPNINFYNEEEILSIYYNQVSEFIKSASGAYKVFAFDHVVRNSDVSLNYAVKNGVKVGGPATVVHGDYAMLGAPMRRDNFALPPKVDDTFIKTHKERPLIHPEEMAELKGRRFAIVNLWRSFIDPPVVDMPLTFCDCATVTKEDYVALEFRYSDRTFETYAGAYSDKQRWYYFPQMTKDEVVLLKTYDSQGILWKNQPNYAPYNQKESSIPVSSTLHSAVKDPRLGQDYAKRQSIEVRTIVFY